MLFKEEKNKKDHPDEIREFVPVSSSFAFKNLRPYLEIAENSFMRTLFSDKIYDQVQKYYNAKTQNKIVDGSGSASSGTASGSGSASSSGIVTDNLMSKVMRFFQSAEINYAFYKGLTKLSVYISNDGIQRISATDSGRQTAYHYQMNALEASFKEDAFTAIDMAFKILENNQEIFPDFKKCSYYTIVKNCFVKNADEFSKIYSISNSRVVFLNLIPHMMKAQDIDFPAKLGAFSQFLKSNLNSNEENLQEIIRLSKCAIVHLTVARAIKTFGVNFTDKGLFFETIESGSISNVKQQLITENEKERMSKASAIDAQQYIETLIAEIKQHPTLQINYSDNNTSREVLGRQGTAWII